MAFYSWSQLARGVVSPHYSTAEGATIKGRRIEVGRYRYPAGTGAKPHRHPEEQVINILAGNLRVRIGGEERVLGAGDAAHIPADTEHEVWSVDGEVEILSCKDILAG